MKTMTKRNRFDFSSSHSTHLSQFPPLLLKLLILYGKLPVGSLQGLFFGGHNLDHLVIHHHGPHPSAKPFACSGHAADFFRVEVGVIVVPDNRGDSTEASVKKGLKQPLSQG